VVEETDQIKQHIERERENLSHNLNEIEYRFKDATDLRAHFERNTGLILGAAVAGGFLLSLALTRSSKSANTNEASASLETDWDAATKGRSSFVSPHLNRVAETVDDIVAGLVGVFSDKLRSFVADAVPGFREQYDSFKTTERASERSGDRSSDQVTRSTFGR
jgi:hypothetical protein